MVISRDKSKRKSGFLSVGDILSGLDLEKQKYITREFQDYGYRLAQILNDLEHKALYIKLAKEVPRPTLEKALAFVKDSRPRSKAKLFMWKLGELRRESISLRETHFSKTRAGIKG
ncbi:hypothetical protein FJZ40_04735 [Candidatus Shapirobacteria bacterium]|nr:hypothetical protein [Candidatus Shapirobacteria bacterium]